MTAVPDTDFLSYFLDAHEGSFQQMFRLLHSHLPEILSERYARLLLE